MKKIYFDEYRIRRWKQGYTLELNSMRPANAPKYRMTKTDFYRQRKIAEANMAINEREPYYFSSLSEIEEYIESVNDIARDTPRS